MNRHGARDPYRRELRALAARWQDQGGDAEQCAKELLALMPAPVAESSRRAAAEGRRSWLAAADERRERYGQLRRGGYTIQQAAWELSVTRRTAERYEARLRANRRTASE